MYTYWQRHYCITIKTLTRCDVAATDQIVMIPEVIIIVTVTWNCDYLTTEITARVPDHTDTVRVKFTRLLTLRQ